MEVRTNCIERSRHGTRSRKLLAVKVLINQAWKRRPRVGSDRSTKLVPSTLGSMINQQSGDEVGHVCPLHGQARIPHPNLVQTGKVQENGIQQDVQIAKTVDHALQDQLQYYFP